MTKMTITDRDKKTLIFTAVVVVATLLWFLVIEGFLVDWKDIRTQLDTAEKKFDLIASSDKLSAADKGLFSIVPVFEMPILEKDQGPVYIKKFNEQLKQSGMKGDLKYLKTISSRGTSGYKTLRLQCQAKGNFNQMVDLLTKLYENPNFVAVEQLNVNTDPKKPGEVDFTLITSTFAK